jgi:carbamoyl-phosphate synthase small subunit
MYLGENFLRKPALLALQDGSLFWGEALGIDGLTTGEVVFNTAITGYQEILTDPSYCQQIITLTYPHIGNVGTNHCDEESKQIFASGLVVRDCPAVVSNWRSERSLDAYLRSHQVVAIAGIDTRRLTRIVREKGAQNGCIMAGDDVKVEQALAAARSFPGLMGRDLAKVVSTQQSYTWTGGIWHLESSEGVEAPTFSYHVVAYDYGIIHNILRVLTEHGCRVTVVPAELPAAQVLNLEPDGIFLSNGPGDPEPCGYAIAAIQELMSAGVPMFGICLGHQLLGLASGARTVKMKFGHHGANHPVQDLSTGRVIISSQNHGFAVDETTLPDCLRATHRSLFDGSLQGIERLDCPAFSFQGHPEASPGPHDVAPLFQRFIAMMRAYQEENYAKTSS